MHSFIHSITSHHITSHHITSHHITSHHIFISSILSIYLSVHHAYAFNLSIYFIVSTFYLLSLHRSFAFILDLYFSLTDSLISIHMIYSNTRYLLYIYLCFVYTTLLSSTTTVTIQGVVDSIILGFVSICIYLLFETVQIKAKMIHT